MQHSVSITTKTHSKFMDACHSYNLGVDIEKNLATMVLITNLRTRDLKGRIQYVGVDIDRNEII